MESQDDVAILPRNQESLHDSKVGEEVPQGAVAALGNQEVYNSLEEDQELEEEVPQEAVAAPGNQEVYNSLEDQELEERAAEEEISAEQLHGCDWAQLSADLLTRIFSALEVPDLISSGAVCKSWNTNYSTVRRLGLSSPGKEPYLLYSSQDQDGDPDNATLHRLSTGRSYRIPVPAPPFHTVGSSHGWLVAADERSELHLFNPVTGVQIDLPPLQTIEHVKPMLKDRQSRTVYGYAVCNITPSAPEPKLDRETIARMPKYLVGEAHHNLYKRVILSADPSLGNRCIVMVIHHPQTQLSYARVGDSKWTWLNASDKCFAYHDCFFDDKDELFYALRSTGEIHTIDFRGPDLLVNSIFPPFEVSLDCTKYIVCAPWGDLLQVWRYFYLNDNEEPKTHQVIVFKPDIAKEDLIDIKDLQGHALFIGFGSSFFVSVKDFPTLNPNCVFLAHDNSKCDLGKKTVINEVVVYNIENDSFVDAPPFSSWMDCPPPIWFRPSCSQHKCGPAYSAVE
ncbi:unnamed protein product [Urochloa decumbens]|uniref:KIB1-4 beta-propeller domain-containing protein n=1 Tax=Urochloa decumbens TaxID=240449 RepID=A0ABC8YW98_9POAL